MVKRTVTALILLAVGMPALLFGGIPYFIFLGFLLLASAYEYTQLFRAMGIEPSVWITLGFF
jgi:CDP-diglyceride synthetase